MPLPRATNSNLFFHSSTNYHTTTITTTTTFSTTTDYSSPFLSYLLTIPSEHRALLLLLTASACSAVIITLLSSTPLQQQPLLLLPLPLLKHSLCPLSRLTGLVVAMEGNKDKDNTDNAPLVRRMHQSPVMYPVCHVTNFI